MYLMANNIGYFSIAATRVMFFNKTIAENHNLGSLYQYVYDGTWTLDKMTEIMKGVSTDLDGNSTLDENDQFGLVNPGYYYCWLEPFDVETYKEDNNGELYYDFQLDKMTSLVEKFYNILFGGEGFNTSYDNATDMFSQNRALFMYDTLETATKIFSLTDVVYGVLPMPKFDENQKEYMGGFTDRPMAIPITVANNLENIGIVTEALNMEGYKQVFPAYYELALKSRYADQSDDAAMIDIIHDNSVMAFTYLYGNHASAYSNMLGTLFSGNSPSTDVASYAAKNEKAQTKYLEKLNEFFSENE